MKAFTVKHKKRIGLLAALCVALLVFSATILPKIVRNKVCEAVLLATGRTLRIESVSINPFTLTIRANRVVMDGKGGGPFVACTALRAAISPASLYKRALILSEVTLEAPTVSFARTGPNRYSFSDILDHIQARRTPDSPGSTLFSVNNITVTNGTIDFNDQIVNGGRQHTVRNLEFSVPFISNMPYLMEEYTAPKLTAVVDGAPFSFAGKLKPFSRSMETGVQIRLGTLNLPRLAAYSPQPLPVQLVTGTVSADVDIQYRISADKKPQLTIKGQAGMTDIDVRLPGGQPLIKLPALNIKASKLDMFAAQLEFETIALSGLELWVNRDAHGHWMYESLVPHGTAAVPAAADVNKAKQNHPPLILVSALTIANGSVHFSDALPKGGFTGDVNNVDVTVRHFTTAADGSTDYDLSLLLDNKAPFRSTGSFSVAPVSVRTSSELKGLDLQRCWPYLSRYLSAPLKGVVDLSGDVSFSDAVGLSATNGRLNLKNLSARYGIKEGVDVSLLSVRGATFTQKDNHLDIAGVTLAKGTMSLSREADGKLSPLSLLAAHLDTPAQKMAVLKQKNTSGKAPHGTKEFSYRVKQIQGDALTIQFNDKTRSEPTRFSLRNTGFSLANLNGPHATPAQLHFSSRFGTQASLKASGSITPQPFRFKGDVTIAKLPIRDFDEYFPDNLNVAIIGGDLSATLLLDMSVRDGKPAGSFKGSAGVRSFHSIDTIAEEDLLKWESLQLDDFQGSLDPFRLDVREIALNGVYSRIIVRKDGTLNLQNLMQKPAAAAVPDGKETVPLQQGTVPVTTGAAPPEPPYAAAAGRQVRIGAVTIQDGTVSFSDNHLSQQFATTFHSLGGRVSGLSSEESQFADVDLRGNLESQSPLQITGKINPLRGDLFVDLKISFHDIELSPVSPYTGNYLGYTVEKGKLFLDLKYHIEKKLLTSENKIFIDQFTFGTKVQSDKATSLPVQLGLALLKDRKGEIHLDIPVVGRTDSPELSIWKLAGQVIKNTLVKAVTSPLALLSSLFGGSEDFSSVLFNSGSSIIPVQEEVKLTNLAKALLDRPALKLELNGYVDRDKDSEAYRRELLDRRLKKEKIMSLGKAGTLNAEENIDTIRILPEEYAPLLTAIYKKEKFPKPRNILGIIKALSPDEMKKLILVNTSVGDAEFHGLARERVVAVMNYLVIKGTVPAERIFHNEDDIYKAPDKNPTSRSRVEINAIVR